MALEDTPFSQMISSPLQILMKAMTRPDCPEAFRRACLSTLDWSLGDHAVLRLAEERFLPYTVKPMKALFAATTDEAILQQCFTHASALAASALRPKLPVPLRDLSKQHAALDVIDGDPWITGLMCALERGCVHTFLTWLEWDLPHAGDRLHNALFYKAVSFPDQFNLMRSFVRSTLSPSDRCRVGKALQQRLKKEDLAQATLPEKTRPVSLWRPMLWSSRFFEEGYDVLIAQYEKKPEAFLPFLENMVASNTLLASPLRLKSKKSPFHTLWRSTPFIKGLLLPLWQALSPSLCGDTPSGKKVSLPDDAWRALYEALHSSSASLPPKNTAHAPGSPPPDLFSVSTRVTEEWRSPHVRSWCLEFGCQILPQLHQPSQASSASSPPYTVRPSSLRAFLKQYARVCASCIPRLSETERNAWYHATYQPSEWHTWPSSNEELYSWWCKMPPPASSHRPAWEEFLRTRMTHLPDPCPHTLTEIVSALLNTHTALADLTALKTCLTWQRAQPTWTPEYHAAWDQALQHHLSKKGAPLNTSPEACYRLLEEMVLDATLQPNPSLLSSVRARQRV